MDVSQGTAFLQVRKSHFCPEETRRKLTSYCGFHENQQQSDCGWLHQ